MEKQRPKIGIGVYILNPQNQVLLMLRKGVGAGTWSPPGGHLEIGEEFIDTVKRETMEEVGLVVEEAEMWAINNNIFPDRHYVNLDYLANKWQGEPKNLEPEKCEKIEWFNLNSLPKPLFEPTENFFKRSPKCFCKSGKLMRECHMH